MLSFYKIDSYPEDSVKIYFWENQNLEYIVALDQPYVGGGSKLWDKRNIVETSNMIIQA